MNTTVAIDLLLTDRRRRPLECEVRLCLYRQRRRRLESFPQDDRDGRHAVSVSCFPCFFQRYSWSRRVSVLGYQRNPNKIGFGANEEAFLQAETRNIYDRVCLLSSAVIYFLEPN